PFPWPLLAKGSKKTLQKTLPVPGGEAESISAIYSKPIKIMKKLPNYRGRISLFMTTCLFMSTMLLETVKAGDFKVPPQATVSGTVTDTDGLPLAGVHIQVESTNKGTISDLDGAFTIEAGPTDELVFSIMG